jgi:hypothetical protein
MTEAAVISGLFYAGLWCGATLFYETGSNNVLAGIFFVPSDGSFVFGADKGHSLHLSSTCL